MEIFHTIYESFKHVVSDSGCIYVATITNGIVIRYNVINRYGGRGANRGIFLDDGTMNIFIYENIIRQTPNGLSIDMRFTTGRAVPELLENIRNTHRLVACNVVDSAIRVEGDPNQLQNGDAHAFSNIRLNGNETAQGNYKALATCTNNIRIDGIINADGTLSITGDYNAITSIDSPLRGETNIY